MLLLLACLLPVLPARATTATAVKWQFYNGSPGPLSASSFSADAPNEYDGSVGDTATGYSGTGGGTLCVLWDLGTSVSVSGVRAQDTGGGSDSAYVSTDGTNWTWVASLSSGSQATFTAVSARYVQLILVGSGPSVTDARVYDASGLVLGPSSAPPDAPTGLSATAGNQFAHSHLFLHSQPNRVLTRPPSTQIVWPVR